MSIIERAINKLDGNDGSTAAEAPKGDTQPGDPGRVSKQAADPPAAANEPQPDATAGRKNRPRDSKPVDDEPQLTVDERRAAPVAKAAKRDTSKLIHIDFERLAAGGFLTLDGGNPGQAEEYQQIKRRLLGNMVPGVNSSDKPANLIMITSSVPGEGKTFTTVNVALSLALEVDHTILVIDTDIVKRDLSRIFGALDRPGLYDLLVDPSREISDVMFRTNIPNLVIIPAGQNRSARTELLASARMKAITNELATRYSDRIVLFDMPPILATSTALALAPQIGQFILVVEANKTKHEIISTALELLDDTPVTGLVLNKSKQYSKRSYDYYGYYAKSDVD